MKMYKSSGDRVYRVDENGQYIESRLIIHDMGWTRNDFKNEEIREMGLPLQEGLDRSAARNDRAPWAGEANTTM